MTLSQSGYHFEPILSGTKHAEIIRQLGKCRYDEDFFLLFRGEKDADTGTYCRLIKQKLDECQAKKIQSYLVRLNENPVGIAFVYPVRTVGKTIDCVCNVWSIDKTRYTEMINAFEETLSKVNMPQSDFQLRIFNPLQNRCLPILPIVYRKEGYNTLLMHLDNTLPDEILSIGSDFSLRRIPVNETGVKQIFDLFENNRAETDRFLAGLSSNYSDIERTMKIFSNKSKVHQVSASVSLFYGLYNGDECVGLCQTECNCSEAEINLLVDKNHDKKGYASETIRLIERELFARGIETVKICCDVENYASARVIQKNKYIYEQCYEPDESQCDTFYHYYKTIQDYIQGAKVTKPLLKLSQPALKRPGMER